MIVHIAGSGDPVFEVMAHLIGIFRRGDQPCPLPGRFADQRGGGLQVLRHVRAAIHLDTGGFNGVSH